MDSLDNMNFTPSYVHPEEEPNIDELNETMININNDLIYLDKKIIESANEYKSLLDNTKLKIKNIKDLILLEKERQEDINILCNSFSDFSSVINILPTICNGNLTFDSNNVLTANTNSSELINYTIQDISGNGYAGNDYVYQNDTFISSTLNTSNKNNINDNNLATYFEYSRITMSDTNEEAPASFNKDSLDAECSISIICEDYVNKLQINTDRDDLILKSVYTSNDGDIYNLDREYDLLINKNRESYNNQTYIYGSGIISFSPTKYIKLYFKSNGYTDENIAYIKTFKNNKTIKNVSSAKRHLIKINEINIFKNSYLNGSLLTNELIDNPIKYIALYCNEYINKDYTVEDNIKYYLIINGIEYEVIPINSQRNGKKIIRTSAQSVKLDNTTYINETIKSAKLKIVIQPVNKNITPYVSNLKVLIGGSNE
jgi:hypothetical protein